MKIKSRFIIFSAIVLVLLVMVLVFVYESKNINKNHQKSTKNNIPTVKASIISKQTIPQTLTSYGTTIAPNSMIIRPQSSGILLSIEFEPGEKVETNQLLFKLKNNDIDNQSQTRKEQLNTSKSQYERYFQQSQELPGSISEMDLLTAKSRYQQDLAAYKEVGDFENILAPKSGVITEADISPGDFVTEGQELAEIVDISKLEVRYQLSSQYADLVKVGQKIYFYPEDNQKTDTIFMGTVNYISPELDKETYNLILRADLPRAQKLLRPYHFGKIMQVINDTYQAYAISQGLVHTDEKGFYFYSLTSNQDNSDNSNNQPQEQLYTVTKYYFEPGEITRFGLVEIKTEIAANTFVLDASSNNVTNGEKVRLANNGA